jgi:hypothetical protein
MADPQATLSIFAEVSVALAGFSGIVIAFGRRSIESHSVLEIRRLSNLFILSGMALIVSLLGNSLLHVDLADVKVLWRSGSAVVFILATPWLIWDVQKVLRLEESERAEVSSLILIVFYSLTAAMLLLQLLNIVVIRESWPFFLALVLMIAGAFQQFILLVRMGYRDQTQSNQTDDGPR